MKNMLYSCYTRIGLFTLLFLYRHHVGRKIVVRLIGELVCLGEGANHES